MSVIEDNRSGVITATKKKTEPPKQYQVSLHSLAPLPFATDCHLNILRDNFNLSAEEAFDKLRTAFARGSVGVFVSSREVVETKAAMANGDIRAHGAHNPFIFNIKFFVEPVEL